MRAEILNSIEAVDPGDWAALVDAREPFLRREFLSALERHGAVHPRLGWQPNHIAVVDASTRLVGLMPMYFKQNSFGEFIYDWSWASAWRQAGLAYYPKLFTGIPYTPGTGPRLWALPGEAQDRIRRLLVKTALDLVAEHGLSSWHVAFPDNAEADLLQEAGLLKRTDIQFHWFNRGYRDFQDFLDTLAADKRRKVRAERRKVADAGINIEQFDGDSVPSGLWPSLHALYETTFDKFGNHPAISAACFAEIGAALRGRMVVFVAWLGGVPIAVSICYRSDDVLYGRYWGASGRFDGLHFELCYHTGIAYCIAHGLSRFEPGAGGEHKVARGFEPTAVTTLHWIADTRMRQVLREHLARLEQSVENYRAEAAEHLPFRSDVENILSR